MPNRCLELQTSEVQSGPEEFGQWHHICKWDESLTVLFTQIQPNGKGIEWCFTLQQNKYPTHTAKATSSCNGVFLISKVNHPTCNQLSMYFTCFKIEDKMHPKQTGIEAGCSTAWHSTMGIDPVSDNVYNLQIWCHQMQNTSNQVFIHCFILKSMYWRTAPK